MEETWDDESTLVEELPQDVRERNQQWNADHRKAAKAERKAAKNQTRFNVITKDDLDRVQDALHQEVDEAKAMATQVPNGQGLLENSIIDNNIAFNTHTFMYSSLRQGIHEKKVAKNNDPKNLAPRTVEEDNAILDPILETLGVCSNLAKSTRERKTVDGKLRTAILEDLEAFVNEQAETMKRMAGYWRYVNRRTYNQMVRNNEVWDWATGAKLPEIEEEIEFGVIEEGHESEEGLLEDETLTSSPPGHTIAGNDNTDESSLQADAASCSLSYHSFGQSADLTTPFTEGGFSSIFSGLDLESGLNRSMESPLSSPESNGSSPQGTVTGRRSSIFKPKREAPPPPVRSGNISPFDGIKDDRVFEQDKHGLAHEASPVRDIHRPRGSVKRPLRGSLATIPPSSSNIFANLNPNLPAPNDEKKVRDRAPGKAPTLTLHVSQSPAAPEAEPGWTLKGAAKKAYPPLPKTPA
ncbi:hypothetical protein MMC21_005393 [Puttea exsequens]|nr:hypothetical protein [Puttea exsequens]